LLACGTFSYTEWDAKEREVSTDCPGAGGSRVASRRSWLGRGRREIRGKRTEENPVFSILIVIGENRAVKTDFKDRQNYKN